MRSLVHQSEILVLSTHDINIVREFCNKILWLEQGVMKCLGSVDEVLAIYN